MRDPSMVKTGSRVRNGMVVVIEICGMKFAFGTTMGEDIRSSVCWSSGCGGGFVKVEALCGSVRHIKIGPK